jgi:hypothetical protein
VPLAVAIFTGPPDSDTIGAPVAGQFQDSVERLGYVPEKTKHPEGYQCDKHDDRKKSLLERRVPHICLPASVPLDAQQSDKSPIDQT